MFIERHAEGNYKTKHAETAGFYYATIHRHLHTYTDTHAETDTRNEGSKEGRLSPDKFTNFIAVPLIHGRAKGQVTGHIGESLKILKNSQYLKTEMPRCQELRAMSHFARDITQRCHAPRVTRSVARGA